MNNYTLEKAAYYYYRFLSETEKELYRKILYALLHHQFEMKIQGNYTAEQVKRISRYVINDRPEIFWYRGAHTVFTSNGRVVSLRLHFLYTADATERIIRNIKYSDFYSQVTEIMSSCKTDFDKVLALYEYIIKNTEYEMRALVNNGDGLDYAFGMDGVILKKRAVCAGYAKAFQYFCSRHNVWCTIVTGQTKRGRHAWNLINIGGSYYYIDATWGDPVFENPESKKSDYVSYDYFCITTESLKSSHQPVFDDNMPLCVSTKHNYYEYFNMNSDFYSVEDVAKHIINAKRAGKSEAVIAYKSLSAYSEAKNKLFAKSEVFKALDYAGRYVDGIAKNASVKYTADDARRTICISLLLIKTVKLMQYTFLT